MRKHKEKKTKNVIADKGGGEPYYKRGTSTVVFYRLSVSGLSPPRRPPWSPCNGNKRREHILAAEYLVSLTLFQQHLGPCLLPWDWFLCDASIRSVEYTLTYCSFLWRGFRFFLRMATLNVMMGWCMHACVFYFWRVCGEQVNHERRWQADN